MKTKRLTGLRALFLVTAFGALLHIAAGRSLAASGDLAITSVLTSPSGNSITAGCQGPATNCPVASMPAANTISTTDTLLTLQATVVEASLNAECRNTAPATRNQCVVVEVEACDTAMGTCNALPTGTVGTLVRAFSNQLAAQNFDYSGAIATGSPGLRIRVAIYKDAAKTMLADEEFFRVSYNNPAASVPIVCISNIPGVNELGRRVTSASSVTIKGRVIPNVPGTKFANPRASTWFTNCSGQMATEVNNITTLSLIKNDGSGPVSSAVSPSTGYVGASVSGAATTFCDEPEPPLTTPGSCVAGVDDQYQVATFTLPSQTISVDKTTNLRLQIQNNLGQTSTAAAPFPGGLDDDYSVVQDARIPTFSFVDASNHTFYVLLDDFDTRLYGDTANPVTINGTTKLHTLVGRVSDLAPGRIAYVGYQLSGASEVSAVNATTRKIMIPTAKYNQITNNGSVPIKAGDVIFFETPSPNANQSYRIQSITDLGYGREITLAAKSYKANTLVDKKQTDTVGIVLPLQANTAYTVTVNGTAYTWPGDPAPSAGMVLTALTALLSADPTVDVVNNFAMGQNTLTLTHKAPGTYDSFVTTTSGNLSVTRDGSLFTVRHTAFAPLRPAITAGGAVNFDDTAGDSADAAAYDKLVNSRGAPSVGDWVIFATNDPANGGQRFQILGTGVRSLTIATTSATGASLVAEVADASRLFIMRDVSKRIDGDDAELGYNCNPCNNTEWAVDVEVQDGPKVFSIYGFDDAGNQQNMNVQINYTDVSVVFAPPTLSIDRIMFYNSQATAISKTVVNVDPTGAVNCNAPLAADPTVCQEISMALPPIDRVLGQWTGVKVIGTISLDAACDPMGLNCAGPAYPDVVGGIGPNLFLDGSLSLLRALPGSPAMPVEFSATNVWMVNDALLSDTLCNVNGVPHGVQPEPLGYCFVWFLDLNVPVITDVASGTLSTLPGSDALAVPGGSCGVGSPVTEIDVVNRDLIAEIGLTGNDQIVLNTNAVAPNNKVTLPIISVSYVGSNTVIEIVDSCYQGTLQSYAIPRSAPNIIENFQVRVVQDNLPSLSETSGNDSFNRDRLPPVISATGFFENELNLTFSPSVVITDANLDLDPADTGIRVYRGTDVMSNISRVNVDLKAIADTLDATPLDDFSVPLQSVAIDLDCCKVEGTGPGQAPFSACTGTPAYDAMGNIPLCDDSFYTLGSANNYCDIAAGPVNRVDPGTYPFRVVCEMPVGDASIGDPTPNNINYSSVILGDSQNERGGYRIEAWARDTAIPPNVVTTGSLPLDFHFGAVVTPSQVFINDFILVFLNEGGSELNPLDVCPLDYQYNVSGDPQSLFECLIDPVFTSLSDNPTTVRNGQNVLSHFFQAFAMVVGGAGGSVGDSSDDAAMNGMAEMALGGIEQLFPTLFADGAVDSDMMTFLNLLQNGIDRGIFDEIPTISLGAVLDPDNNPLTRDGIESLESTMETVFQVDGRPFLLELNDNGAIKAGVQQKSSSLLLRMTPVVLDILAFEDLRGTIDVLNRLRFLDVPHLDDQGRVITDREAAVPILYSIFESVFDTYDPDFYVDTVKNTSAIIYDYNNDGVLQPQNETRCYAAYGSAGVPACIGGSASGCGVIKAAIQSPGDCFCDVGVLTAGECTTYGLVRLDTLSDPYAAARLMTRSFEIFTNDACEGVATTADKQECLDWVQMGVAPTYSDSDTAIFEDPTTKNLRTILHEILNSETDTGISVLTSLLDILLCVFEPVRDGTVLRESSMARFAPILAAIINQTGARHQAKCSAGGQFIDSRRADVQCSGSGYSAGQERLMQGARGVECPLGERVRLDINNRGLAPAEYCTQGELMFQTDDALSRLMPAMETLTSPTVLNEINRVIIDFPDTDIILSSLVATSDLGLFKRTLVTIAQIFDTSNKGQRYGIPECGTPGAVVGSCRVPAEPVAEIALDGINDQLTAVPAPLVTCDSPGSPSAVTCLPTPLPGTVIDSSSHPGCKTPGQKVFCNAEKLPLSVTLDTFDELFVNNPPSGCEFYQNHSSPPTTPNPATTISDCLLIQGLDFDKLNSIWDFLDEFVNVFMTQGERDLVMEALPTMMGGHQKAASGIRVQPPNYKRIIPGPRPVVTSTQNFGNPDTYRTSPTGEIADTIVWPPDRAFPSAIVDCVTSGNATFVSSGAADTCWKPDVFMPTTIPGRPHGRNAYDRYLCDNFDCLSGSACGGLAGAVGAAAVVGGTSAAQINEDDCTAKGKMRQRLANPYYGCWNNTTNWRWNLDVLFTDPSAIPETPADCFDSPDMTRGLDEQVRQYMGLDMVGDLGQVIPFLGTIPININELLSSVSGFSDPQMFPTSNLTYKIFGLNAEVPKAEILTLFSSLRAARGLLSNPLIGGAIGFRQGCTGFVAAESGSFTWSVHGPTGTSTTFSTQGRRVLATGIDRTAALEPLVTNDAFEALQKMLAALVRVPNQWSSSDPRSGLYQTNNGADCAYRNSSTNGIAVDVYPTQHVKNPAQGILQMVWGQSPVFLQFLSTFENMGYAQTSMYDLLVGIEEGPQREILDSVFEVLGDWREVTADLDSRIPPGRNFMRVALDGVDNLISPQDGTTVPCGNDGASCNDVVYGPGKDGKNFPKSGTAEPFLYPLFPTLLEMGGIRAEGTGYTLKICTLTNWTYCNDGVYNNRYGIVTAPASFPNAFAGVVDCGANANGGQCQATARPDHIYVKCQGTSGAGCDTSNPAGALLPGTGAVPGAANYSYLGHTFKIIHKIDNRNVVVSREAVDEPTISIDTNAAQQRLVDVKVQTFVRTSMSLGMRAIGRIIVDDYNQDPDVPGVNIFEVDEVIADLVRCDTEGFFIDTMMGFLDDKTPASTPPSGDLRPLRNTIFSLNKRTDVRDAVLDLTGETMGATGGGEIDYWDVCVCARRDYEIVAGSCPDPSAAPANRPGTCRANAPLVSFMPLLREGAIRDVEEQFAMQASLDNLVNPFNQRAIKRMSSNPAACTGSSAINSRGIPKKECVAFLDPVIDAAVTVGLTDTNEYGSGNDSKIAETAIATANKIAGEVPDPRDSSDSDLTAFRGQLKQIMGGAGVGGLDTYTSLNHRKGDCNSPQPWNANKALDGARPGRPDGVLDDCNGNNVPDFVSRLDDGVADGRIAAGNSPLNPNFAVGTWFYNDSGRSIEITTVSFEHDGSPGRSSNNADKVGRLRVLATSSMNPLATGRIPNDSNGAVPGDACFFSTSDNCGPGRLRVEDFYFRDRMGIQPVSVYPPLTVPAGYFVYITIQQPSLATSAGRMQVGVDTTRFTAMTNQFIDLFGGLGNLVGGEAVQAGDNVDFMTSDLSKVRRVESYLGVKAVPMIRAGFAYPIQFPTDASALEDGIALFRRVFDKPIQPTASNPEQRRPVEPLFDALAALVLPLDVAPKLTGNVATEVPARCNGPVGSTGNPNEIFVFLPTFEVPAGGVNPNGETAGTLRRQRCDYYAGGTPPLGNEMEQGLGCYDYLDTTPDGVPCWATPRGMVPVDLDDAINPDPSFVSNFATPLELLIPLIRRLALATYADPNPSDMIDPDIILFDTFPFWEMLVAQIPPLSCDEVNALNGNCSTTDPNRGEIITPGAMTSLIDRLLILPKILVLISNEPSQPLYRFFDHPADVGAVCPGAPPPAKCPISANLLDVLSALSKPVTFYDRATGITDSQPMPVLIRLTDHMLDAFFPPPANPPILPPQTLPPRISLADFETEIVIREGYGSGGVGAPVDCTEYDRVSDTYAVLPGCKFYVEATVEHGQIPSVQATINEVQKIEFSAVPTTGTWTLTHNDGMNAYQTSSLAYNITALALQNALNALPSLTNVQVSGDTLAGFTVTFAGVDGNKVQNTLISGNTGLQSGATPVIITVVRACDLGLPCALSGSQPFAGAVVSVKLPDDVEAGKTNALHVAAFNDAGTTRGSILAMQLWGNAAPPRAIQTGDKLEYGILVPSISHVKNVSVDVVFSGGGTGAWNQAPCTTNSNGVFNVETVRNFEALPTTPDIKGCLRNNALKYGNKTDQAGRPAEPSYELTDAADKFIFRRIPLSGTNSNEANYTGKTIQKVLLEFDTSLGGPRGRAEAYISFLRFVDVNGNVWFNVYDGGTGLPTGGNTVIAQNGYQNIDEVNTCVGAALPGACNALIGAPVLNTRKTAGLCIGCTAPACGSYDPAVFTSMGDLGAIGTRGCDTPDGRIRIKTDFMGRIRFPVSASLIPYLNRIELQVRCGGDVDGNMDAVNDCEEQHLGTDPELEIRKGGDSAPVVFQADTRFPPRPLDMFLATTSGLTRPVYQDDGSGNGWIDDPSITDEAPAPIQDDAFFLDTEVQDQQGDPFTGYVCLPPSCPGASPVFIPAPLEIDYAVVRRPALELRSDFSTTSTTQNYNVIGTGDESSTGPYIVKAGDYLEYEIYIPNSLGNAVGNAPNAGIDIQSATPNDGSLDLRTAVYPGLPVSSDTTDKGIANAEGQNSPLTDLSGRPMDQNLRIADARAELATTGTPPAGENFYYRRIPLPEGFVLSRGDATVGADKGSRIFAALWAPGTPAAAGMSAAYFRNIRIGSGGEGEYSIYDEGSGRKVLRLSGSGCNNWTGGADPRVTSQASCPIATNDANLARCIDPNYAGNTVTLVFEEFTGLNALPQTGTGQGLGDRIILETSANYDLMTGKASNADAGRKVTLHYQNQSAGVVPPANGTPAANSTVLEACNVSRDPIVVFKGTTNGDWRSGAGIRVNSQNTTKALGAEDQLWGTGYNRTALCASTEFAIGSGTNANLCRPLNYTGSGGAAYGQAVGDGRFCPNGTGATAYGKRCDASDMRTLDADTDPSNVNYYATGKSHVVQRSKPVLSGGQPTGTHRFVYTMGVSSGRQNVEIRTNKATHAAPGQGIDDVPGELRPYVHLLPTQDFEVFGNPPPVPTKVVFRYSEEETTNGLSGGPGNFANLHIRVLDQYDRPWQKPAPVKWDVTLPKNAIRMRGRATRTGAFLGLKLNTGITSQPRYEYPVSGIANSSDADQIAGNIMTLATDSENTDGDNVLRFTAGDAVALIPGDTVRIGINQTNDFTAVVRNVNGDYVEFEKIYYLGAECNLNGLTYGIDTVVGTDGNRKSKFVDCDTLDVNGNDPTPPSLSGYQVYMANPLTAGDDFPCNENTAYGGQQGNPPTCAQNSRFSTCVGGNFNRGADGAWRHVTQYKTDDSGADGPPTTLRRHCYELNFAVPTGNTANGASIQATAGNTRVGRDVSVGDMRIEFSSFGAGGMISQTRCDYFDGATGTQGGAVAWNCLPSQVRYEMMQPSAGGGGHVGFDYAGLRQNANIASINLGSVTACLLWICIPIDLGTMNQPQTSYVQDIFGDFHVGRFVAPYNQIVTLGTSTSSTSSDQVMIWGDDPPGSSVTNYGRADIIRFNAKDTNFTKDQFVSRTLILPRVALWAAEPTITRLVCTNETNGCAWGDGNMLEYDSNLAGADRAFARHGVWMAMAEGTRGTGTTVNQDYDFFMRKAAIRGVNDFMILITANIELNDIFLGVDAQLDMPNPAAVPFFFTDNIYDGGDLLPSSSVSNYGQLDCSGLSGCAGPGTADDQEVPSGTNDNDGAFSNVDIRVAGGQGKVCGEAGKVSIILPGALTGTTRLDLSNQMKTVDGVTNCTVTADGQSRPGSYTIARINDAASCSTSSPGAACDGEMFGRLYFPPWGNDQVQIEVSAPGTPPLTYKRNLVIGTPQDTINLPPQGLITSHPGGTATVLNGGIINFTGSCTDPDNNTPFTHEWDIPGGVPSSSTAQSPGNVTFPTPGTYLVRYLCTDSLGLPDPQAATVVVTVTSQPPNGTITTPPGNVSINQWKTVNFTSTCTDPENDTPFTHDWQFPGGLPGSSIVKDPGIVQFVGTADPLPGVTPYVVSYTCIDKWGTLDPSPATRTITVTPNDRPVAAILTPATNQAVPAGTAINFTGSCTNTLFNPVTYSWSFPGGTPSSSTAQNPGNVTFNTMGVYNVTFTCTDSDGITDETPATVRIQVGNAAPTAVIDLPSSNLVISEGSGVTYFGSCIDLEGNAPYTHSWSFTGGVPNSSTAEDPGQVTYATPGTYTASYSCTDCPSGGPCPDALSMTSGITTRQIRVNAYPNGTITAPLVDPMIDFGQSAVFSSTCTDPDGNGTGMPGTDLPSFSHFWNFQGGAINSILKDPGAVTFVEGGIYNVTYTCIDADGALDPTPDLQTITVYGEPDGIITNPVDGAVILSGTLVNFTSTCIDAVEGTDNPLFTHAWDFGGAAPNSTVKDPSVTLNTPGTYLVTYTCTNTRPFSDPTPSAIMIRVNGVPNGTISTPMNGTTLAEGSPVTFTSTCTDPDGNGVGMPLTDSINFDHLWDFAGLDTSTLKDPGTVVFPGSGSFVITYTCYDADGAADPTPAQVTVNMNGAPDSIIDTPAGGASVVVPGAFNFTGHCTDPEGDTPYTYAWTFPAGFVCVDFANCQTLEDPGNVRLPITSGATATNHSVTMKCTDSFGIQDPSAAAVSVTVTNNRPTCSLTATNDVNFYFDGGTNLGAGIGNNNGTSTLTSTLNVPLAGTVVDANIRTWVTHRYDGDVRIYINDPGAGAQQSLTIDNGGSGDNYQITTFDQSAGTNITAGSPPYNGTYAPEGGNLAAFNGLQSNGNWTLTVQDVTCHTYSCNCVLWICGTCCSPSTGTGGCGGSSCGQQGELQNWWVGLRYTVTTGNTLRFNAGTAPDGNVDFTSTCSDGDPGHTIVGYSWSFLNGNPSSSTSQNVSNVNYASPGNVLASVMGQDSYGLWSNPFSITMDVYPVPGGNFPPNALILTPATNITVPRNTAVNFTAQCQDAESDPINAHQWTFPSGTPSSSTVQNPGNVSWATSGVYTVSYTCRDSGSGFFDFSPDTRQITVNDPPNGTVPTPGATLMINELVGQQFLGQCTDTENDTPFTYCWDFPAVAGGDDNPTTCEYTTLNANNGNPLSFNAGGNYTVTFTCLDSLGQPDPTPFNVAVTVIGNVPPETQINTPADMASVRACAGPGGTGPAPLCSTTGNSTGCGGVFNFTGPASSGWYAGCNDPDQGAAPNPIPTWSFPAGTTPATSYTCNGLNPACSGTWTDPGNYCLPIPSGAASQSHQVTVTCTDRHTTNPKSDPTPDSVTITITNDAPVLNNTTATNNSHFTGWTNGTDVNTVDAGTISTAINVPIAGTVVDAEPRVNLAHRYDGDVTIRLASPGVGSTTMAANNGGAGDNYSITRFDQTAGTNIASGAPPYNGTYAPEIGSLNSFNGTSINGNWTLYVDDNDCHQYSYTCNCVLWICSTCTSCSPSTGTGGCPGSTCGQGGTLQDWWIYLRYSVIQNQTMLINNNTSITFQSGCTDPDGHVLVHSWNFGAGAAPATSTAASVSVTYSTVGTRTVTYSCSDEYGRSAGSHTITVTTQ